MFLVKGPDPIKCQSIISKSVEDANTRSLSIPLEKQTSHLLAISIYLTACVWLIWKTQSTCLFLLRNRPLLCNLQVFCNPKRTVLKRTAREAGWVLSVAWLLCSQFYKWRGYSPPPPVSSPSLPSLGHNWLSLLASQRGWGSQSKCVWEKSGRR